ncbi:MAG: FAD-dependent oxidoreductase [Saprospiraceae bacterium]|nr:FAD-dependent oxidoreductase [Lewinella sp.]
MPRCLLLLLFPLLFGLLQCRTGNLGTDQQYEIIVIGGGASGVMAGIQAARMGRKTLILEETSWLGGMLTAAGVSAVDGNYKLPSGLWEEFRQKLYDHYGGADSVKTGWVSNVLFEPNVGADILAAMTNSTSQLDVHFNTSVDTVIRLENKWKVRSRGPTGKQDLQCRIIIDGTELGDIAKMTGVRYNIGMDARSSSGEDIAPAQSNDIIQDLTYVAILQEFDKDSDHTIDKPEGYDESLFYCTCAGICDQDTIKPKLWDCQTMMDYGRLPNGKVMINWPIFGNDYYVNAIEASPEERRLLYEKAKWYTQCYVYYLQTHLGFRHFSIAEDVFPTADHFPMIPYHRESRRIQGIVRFTLNDLARPFEQTTALYRTGIAVGDYPVDHHHRAYPDYGELPDLHFYPVPSYALPLGTLIPAGVDGLIVAEKSISVTNIVNGTTRLQPVCLLIGQAAGTLAALSVELDLPVGKVPVRKVQESLLAYDAMILPYADVDINDPAFAAVQRIGATGMLKGEGKNIGWSNLTLFYPDSLMTRQTLLEGVKEILLSDAPKTAGEENLTIEEGYHFAEQLRLTLQTKYPGVNLPESSPSLADIWQQMQLSDLDPKRSIKRKEMAVLLDQVAAPFSIPVDHFGYFQQ